MFFHQIQQVLMMTLQNDPPTLESVSEYEDQYKNYGKSIRKLIVDCLQKDPARRPTASELLKHPFIKKAKDRRYLMQTLLPNTPSFAERSRRALDAKRGSGLDGGENGESGGWVWPADEGADERRSANDDVDQRLDDCQHPISPLAATSTAPNTEYSNNSSSGSQASTTDGASSGARSHDASSQTNHSQ